MKTVGTLTAAPFLAAADDLLRAIDVHNQLEYYPRLALTELRARRTGRDLSGPRLTPRFHRRGRRLYRFGRFHQYRLFLRSTIILTPLTHADVTDFPTSGRDTFWSAFHQMGNLRELER